MQLARMLVPEVIALLHPQRNPGVLELSGDTARVARLFVALPVMYMYVRYSVGQPVSGQVARVVRSWSVVTDGESLSQTVSR